MVRRSLEVVVVLLFAAFLVYLTYIKDQRRSAHFDGPRPWWWYVVPAVVAVLWVGGKHLLRRRSATRAPGEPTDG